MLRAFGRFSFVAVSQAIIVTLAMLCRDGWPSRKRRDPIDAQEPSALHELPGSESFRAMRTSGGPPRKRRAMCRGRHPPLTTMGGSFCHLATSWGSRCEGLSFGGGTPTTPEVPPRHLAMYEWGGTHHSRTWSQRSPHFDQ